jgi:hypothetical protein
VVPCVGKLFRDPGDTGHGMAGWFSALAHFGKMN